MQSFASDNNSGACPEAIAAIVAANEGHAFGYGEDRWTESATALFKKEFGAGTEVFFVLNGTGSNVFGLSLASGHGEAVLCSDCAHVQVDETAAAEAVAGCKVIPCPSREGKILPEGLVEVLGSLNSIHQPRPTCLTLTEPTEIGTLYSLDELRELTGIAHRAGLAVHLDGARIANAAAALGLPLRAFGPEAGVDLMSFGGMKNGLAFGETLLAWKPELARKAPYLRKTHLQLDSKMRFIACQFEAYLKGELWRRNASAANAAAARLAKAIAGTPGLELAYPVQANALFVKMSPEAAAKLRERHQFYDWEGGLVRWMTSFDTTDAAVDAFAADARAAAKGSA